MPSNITSYNTLDDLTFTCIGSGYNFNYPTTTTITLPYKEESNKIEKPKYPTVKDLIDLLLEDDEIEELNIERIIFNDPATIIFWSDGEKTVVKTAEGDTYSPYYGFCCAVTKRLFGNNSAIKKLMKRKGNLDTI